MTENFSITKASMSEIVRSILAELRPAELPSSASAREIIYDSLQHMRFIVALEERLNLALDDDVVMAIKFDREDELIEMLLGLIGSTTTRIIP